MSPVKSNPDIDMDDIEIRVVTQDDRPQVLDLLLRSFFPYEPINAYTEPRGHIQQEEIDSILANIEHGTSCIAIQRSTNKAVGVCMAGPQNGDKISELFEEAAKLKGTKWGNVLYCLGCIERNIQVYKRYNVQKIMYVAATCVDATKRGQGIGARLYNGVRDVAKKSGYELLRADCSSYYSARIKEQLGWDCINVLDYKDCIDENNQLMFNIQLPHVCCKSYAIRL